jgi:hypothetical protein
MKIHKDLAVSWLIGIIEGEGWCGFDSTQRVEIKMVDKDVIEKCASIIHFIVGGDRLRIAIKPEIEHQDQYRVAIQGARARALMREIAPFMGERRRGVINLALQGERTAQYKNLDLVKLLKIGEEACLRT